MATTVVCNVVQLAQHPPPVHVPTERVSLPNPIPSQHGHRRATRENHGGFRWHRPAFQPFQLKPWARDTEMEDEMRESLAVIGPHTMMDLSRLPHPNSSHHNPHHHIQQHQPHPRSFTAPPAVVSSMEMRKNEPAEKKEKTALSSPSIRDLLTPATKRSVATFPARPPFSCGKQIPGRFFPKPTLTEEQRVQIELFKRMKPPPRKASSLVSATPSRRAQSVGDRGPVFESVERTATMFDASSASAARLADRQHSASFNRRIARNRQQLHKDTRMELRSEVFAICFKQDLDTVTTAYDPHSELHSDYYSIKRLKMPAARLGRAVKTNIDDFAVVLQGHSKHLHKKFLMSTGSSESLDSILPLAHHAAAIRSGGSLTRRTVMEERDPSPRKVIDIETPMANGGGRESDEHSEASGAEQDQDNTLAPLNSPTGTADHKYGGFPALN